MHSAIGLQSVGVSSINCAGSTHTSRPRCPHHRLRRHRHDRTTSRRPSPTKLVGAGPAEDPSSPASRSTPRVKLTARATRTSGQSVTLFQKPAGSQALPESHNGEDQREGVAMARHARPRVTTLVPVAVRRQLDLSLRQRQPLLKVEGCPRAHPAAREGRRPQRRAARRIGDADPETRRHHGEAVATPGKKTRVLIAKGTVHHDGDLLDRAEPAGGSLPDLHHGRGDEGQHGGQVAHPDIRRHRPLIRPRPPGVSAEPRPARRRRPDRSRRLRSPQ